MFTKLEFNATWTERIMNCVETVSYRLKINGVRSDIIKPGRRIRQGDLVSPYLFLLCREWLSLALSRKQEENKIVGMKIAQSSLRINHLLFADDYFIFLNAHLAHLKELKHVLPVYELADGRKINLQKSKICVCNNMDAYMGRLCEDFMGMNIVAKHSKYLGLPLLMGLNKAEIFNYLEDKMQINILD